MANKIGWIVSGVLVLALAGFVVWRVAFPPQTEPTITAEPGMLEVQKPSASPAAFAGGDPGGAGNAGDDYAQAAALVEENMAKLAEADAAVREQKTPGPEALGLLKRVHGLVTAGAEKREMDYVFAHTPEKLQLSREYPPASDLQNVAGALTTLALYYFYQGEYDKAEEVWLDQFQLGRHMMQERDLVAMTQRGYGVQSLALNDLRVLYKETNQPDKRAAVDNYAQALQEVSDWHRRKVNEAVWQADPLIGDLINIVENDADPAWRNEALLYMGIARHTAKKKSDRAKIKELLDQYASGAEPVSAAAARWAKQTPPDILHTFGSRQF